MIVWYSIKCQGLPGRCRSIRWSSNSRLLAQIVAEEHTAIDPVCEMEVDIASARWISEHEGETYYFCAPGCKTAFEKDPTSFLATEAI